MKKLLNFIIFFVLFTSNIFAANDNELINFYLSSEEKAKTNRYIKIKDLNQIKNLIEKNLLVTNVDFPSANDDFLEWNFKNDSTVEIFEIYYDNNTGNITKNTRFKGTWNIKDSEILLMLKPNELKDKIKLANKIADDNFWKLVDNEEKRQIIITSLLKICEPFINDEEKFGSCIVDNIFIKTQISFIKNYIAPESVGVSYNYGQLGEVILDDMCFFAYKRKCNPVDWEDKPKKPFAIFNLYKKDKNQKIKTYEKFELALKSNEILISDFRDKFRNAKDKNLKEAKLIEDFGDFCKGKDDFKSCLASQKIKFDKQNIAIMNNEFINKHDGRSLVRQIIPKIENCMFGVSQALLTLTPPEFIPTNIKKSVNTVIYNAKTGLEENNVTKMREGIIGIRYWSYILSNIAKTAYPNSPLGKMCKDIDDNFKLSYSK